MTRKTITAIAVAAAAATMGPVAAGTATAQDYPSRPIRMLVGYPAGGGVDFFARVAAQKLSEQLKQQVVIDNRAGAASNIASEMTAKANPDGYTLLVTNIAFAVNPALFAKMPFDTPGDFTMVSQIATLANALVVHPSVGVTNVKELIALARGKPGQLNYASAGNGTSTHLAGELFKNVAGIDILHVPYKGAPPAVTATVAGQVQMMFATLPTALPQVRAGKLRALGVTGAKRSNAAPELPTVSEAGLPGFDVSSWIALMAPAKTPPAIVARLNRALVEGFRSPDVGEYFAREGGEAVTGTPDQLTAYVKSEIAKWAKVVKAAGIRAD
jgi:tripartite-type tricarboxylate transporter receptor subunit TctC